MISYTDLITSEHADRPDFAATVEATTEASVDLSTILSALPEGFDIDTATGVQLDAVGLWVGITRKIETPLTGIYFAWGGTASEGWGAGVWKGEYDPSSGLTSLPDDSYRKLLKTKIAANRWDGTIPGAYEALAGAFGDSTYILVQDNQDMSMTVGVSGAALSSADKAILTGGYLPLKPAGIGVKYYSIAPSGGKLFAWGIENEALAGWGTGSWGETITPPA